jgi:hypothetical protein
MVWNRWFGIELSGNFTIYQGSSGRPMIGEQRVPIEGKRLLCAVASKILGKGRRFAL